MRIICSDEHRLHVSPGEFGFGEFVPAFEIPERVDIILGRAREVGLGSIEPPRSFPLDRITAVHAPSLVNFLRTAHSQWAALRRPGAAYPIAWAGGGMRRDRTGGSVDTQLARFCTDAATPITATTWTAVLASAHCALTAAEVILGGEQSAFALCRPPGHHAGIDHYGGYCFLNNAAIAAQMLRDRGMRAVAIVDIDYHHGNGTQNIFYARGDVLFTSIHADPDFEFPFLLGYADETGVGAGEGANLNLPLPEGTAGSAGPRRWSRRWPRSAASAPKPWSSRSASIPSRAIRSPGFVSKARIFSASARSLHRCAFRCCLSWKAATRSTRSASTRSMSCRASRPPDPCPGSFVA